MTMASPKNHFHIFKSKMRMSFMPTMNINMGMRNDGKPKFNVMK